MAESIDMAKRAVEEGITHLFATPHHGNGRFENTKTDILKHVTELNKRLTQENIPLTVLPGQELRIHRELFHALERDEILTLHNRGKYVLLELPSNEVPTYTKSLIYELLLKGITPIIVHPERNRELITHQNLLYELVTEGALTQLTAGSIIGQFGKKIQSFSEKIIEHHLTHFVASDAHNLNSRGLSSLQAAFATVTRKYGIDRTFYFQENAELLVRYQNPLIEQPHPIKKRLLGIF